MYDVTEILKLSREVFWNLIGTANCRAVEVSSLNSDKLPGHFFFNERPGYEATEQLAANMAHDHVDLHEHSIVSCPDYLWKMQSGNETKCGMAPPGACPQARPDAPSGSLVEHTPPSTPLCPPVVLPLPQGRI